MKNFLVGLFFLISGLYAFNTQAVEYEGDGAWAVHQYEDGTYFVLSLGVYREKPTEGAMPTFMINYGEGGGCFISFGLTMLEQDIPQQLTRKQALRMLEMMIEQSDFFADNEVLERTDDRVQGLDMGGVIFARTLIDSDSLAAFMLARNGSVRMRNEDLVIMFDMSGLENTMNHLIDKNCN